MTEPTPATEPAAPAAPAAAPPQAPPWGEDFDPARAWDKIQKANREAEGLRSRLKEAEPKLAEYDRLEQASKSELQRIQEAHDAEKARADSSSAEALRMRVAIEHGVSKEDLDLLGSGTEEQIAARAQRIAAIHAAQQATQPTPPPAPNTPVLLPGATPSTPPGDDVAARHARFFANRTA